MLQVESLSKSFDRGKTFALKDVSFHLKEGGVYAIIGESGSGKTTLIRLITGLESPDSGTITLHGREVSSVKKIVKPENRNIGLVFQEYALFPHLNVLENVLYGISKLPNKKERAEEVLQLVDLLDYKERYPHQLSGGQQQRVALARALAPKPSLLILDEPFSNLDTMLRAQLRNEIFAIIKSSGITAIFVTHDTQDALSVADEILILQNGKLIQKDDAVNLYTRPKSVYVASLFGTTIQLTKELQSAFECPLKANCCHAVRNENITISDQCDFVTHATVVKQTFLGNEVKLILKLDNGEHLTVTSQERVDTDRITIGFNSKDVLEFAE